MSPIDMHTDVELEWKYIRRKIEEYNDVRKQQIGAGLLSFKKGDKVLVYLDLSKTNKSMRKRRRNFDRQATFIRYQNGNAVVVLDKPIPGFREILLPIYYVKAI